MEGEGLKGYIACFRPCTIIFIFSADDQEIVINGTQSGLGIRIVGGQRAGSSQESDFGIFIKEVIPQSLAERDGIFD